MKKVNSILTAALVATTALAAVPFPVSAAEASDWKPACKEAIQNFVKNRNLPASSCTWELYDVNQDGTPELIIRPNDEYSQVFLYAYKDGEYQIPIPEGNYIGWIEEGRANGQLEPNQGDTFSGSGASLYVVEGQSGFAQYSSESGSLYVSVLVDAPDYNKFLIKDLTENEYDASVWNPTSPTTQAREVGRAYTLSEIDSVLDSYGVEPTDPVTEPDTQPTEPTTEPLTGTVYGTMQIPYADFFKAEFEGAKNSDVEVDAVSSATTSKWKMNNVGSVDAEGKWTAGGLVAGTYYAEGENGGGKILGVVYPVAVQAENVDFLKERYNFTLNADPTAVPTAYKEVTVNGEDVTFSKINDTDGVQEVGGNVTVKTQTRYGDYQIQVENYPKDADTYGVLLKTTDGNYYALRALENIWRNGEYAWSVGYVKTVHGNNIDNEDYHSLNGATISEITMITLDGYRTISNLNTYLPEIFTAGIKVNNGKSGTGAVTGDIKDFPADFKPVGTVANGFAVTFTGDGTVNISYTNAQPSSYTVTISDENKKYADVTGTFILSTDKIPAQFDGTKLVPADGFTQEDVDNFIKNISSVQVGDKTYTTGKRGTTIVKTDGTVDTTVKANNEAVFAEGQTHKLVVTATGYEKPLEFEVTVASTAPALKDVPVAYDKDNKKLVVADGHTQEEADDFIKNITSVQVDDSVYGTSTNIIKTDGTVNTSAKSDNKSLFTAGNDYKLIVNATGYKPLAFTLSIESSGGGSGSNGGSSGSSNNKSSSSSSSSKTAAPKTGQSAGAAPYVALASILGLLGIVSKKNKK